MRFLIVGDPQIYCTDPTSVRSEKVRNGLTWMLSVIDETRPDYFVCLGDYGESHQGVDHYSLTLMTWFMSEVGRRFPPGHCFWLAGNHDYYNADGSVNLMYALSYLASPHHVIPRPWATGPEQTVFVNYLKDRDQFRAEVGLVWGPDPNQVLFSHVPVNGATLRYGRYDPDGVDPACLPNFTFVGHYHHPKIPEATSPGEKLLWYAGSPFAWDFRDNIFGLSWDQQRRGIWLANIAAGQVLDAPQFFENPHTDYYVSLRSEVADDGILLDPWLTGSLTVPYNRVHLQVTVPAARKELVLARYTNLVKALTVLTESTTTVASNSTTVSPNLPPEDVAAAYLVSGRQSTDGLNVSELARIGRGYLSGHSAISQ